MNVFLIGDSDGAEDKAGMHPTQAMNAFFAVNSDGGHESADGREDNAGTYRSYSYTANIY